MSQIPEWLAPIIVSMTGGFTNFLMDENHSVIRFVISIVSSGFAGFLIFQFCQEFGYSERITAIACGISGLSGEAILKIIRKFSVRTLKDKLKNY